MFFKSLFQTSSDLTNITEITCMAPQFVDTTACVRVGIACLSFQCITDSVVGTKRNLNTAFLKRLVFFYYEIVVSESNP
jgi:hypothetical protein